jgi:hypothetical protein
MHDAMEETLDIHRGNHTGPHGSLSMMEGADFSIQSRELYDASVSEPLLYEINVLLGRHSFEVFSSITLLFSLLAEISHKFVEVLPNLCSTCGSKRGYLNEPISYLAYKILWLIIVILDI